MDTKVLLLIGLGVVVGIALENKIGIVKYVPFIGGQ